MAAPQPSIRESPPGSERCYVSLPSGEVHLRVHGSGPVPLVLLHDSPGSAAALVSFAAQFPPQFRVICVDLPGHGATTTTGRPVDDVAEALRAFGVRRAAVAGTGLGAAFAAALAADAPDVCATALVHAGQDEPITAVLSGAPRPGGGHLLDAWWAVRRSSMTRPWWSQRAADRTAAVPADAAEVHAVAVDVMDRAAASGVAAPIPGESAARGASVLTTWVPEAVGVAVQAYPAGWLAERAPHTVGRVGYVSTRSGLVHYRRAASRSAAPAGPCLVVLPPAPGSSASLVNLLEALSIDRDVIALDYPGHGRSDPLRQHASLAVTLTDYLDVIDDSLEALGLAEADLYGSHSGALLAVLYQRRYPERIRALLLDGVPLGSAFRGYDLERYLPDLAPDIDGHHVLSAWAMANDRVLWAPWYRHDEQSATWQRAMSLDAISDWTIDLLRGADTYRQLYRLILEYALEDDGVAVTGPPTMICRAPGDALDAYVDTVAELLPFATVIPTGGYQSPSGAAVTAAAVSAFLCTIGSRIEST